MTADDNNPSLRRDPMQIGRLLKNEAGEQKLPPIHLWNPAFCGDIDMEIKRNGQWFYMGTPIGRPALVKLFSSVMRREDDDAYYLVTPVEKVRIRVEDAPFIITLVERIERDGEFFVQLTTQTGDVVVASAEHPIWVTYKQDEPHPCVHIRDRLHALIGRNAYYQLIEWGTPRVTEAGPHELVLASAGATFVIGHF